MIQLMIQLMIQRFFGPYFCKYAGLLSSKILPLFLGINKAQKQRLRAYNSSITGFTGDYLAIEFKSVLNVFSKW